MKSEMEKGERRKRNEKWERKMERGGRSKRDKK